MLDWPHIRRAGGSTHPLPVLLEAGSRLAAHPQLPVGEYRRVQLARYLIDEDLATAETFSFDERGRRSPARRRKPPIGRARRALRS